MKSVYDFFWIAVVLSVLASDINLAVGQPVATGLKFDTSTKTIEGLSGGPVDSKGCGFIATSPNHVIQLSKRMDYMRLQVRVTGGQPTLLVLGPQSGDSFCVLGDELSEYKPEISGVWEAGEYQVFIGDRTGANYQFTLDISTNK